MLGGGLFWFFRTWAQEREVRRFFDLLARRDYAAAYTEWGCTEASPCRDYPFPDFLKDWGPEALPQPGSADITGAETCGSGVIVRVRAGAEERVLWVERSTSTVGFSPVNPCPFRSPLKIMLTRLRDSLR